MGITLREAHGQFYGRTQRFFEKVIHSRTSAWRSALRRFSAFFGDFSSGGVSNRDTPPKILGKNGQNCPYWIREMGENLILLPERGLQLAAIPELPGRIGTSRGLHAGPSIAAD